MMVVHLGGPLQQTGVQVEHITRVGLSSRGTSQQQGHLTVGHGLLGQIVVDDQGMTATISEVFSNGTTRVGGQELEGGSLRGGGSHDDGVAQGSVVRQDLDDVGHGGPLLSDGHVDAVELSLGLSRLEVLLLVDDSINSQGGLTSLSITNDQLSLASSDRHQTVDSLKASLHGLVDTLPRDNARGLDLHPLAGRGLHRA